MEILILFFHGVMLATSVTLAVGVFFICIKLLPQKTKYHKTIASLTASLTWLVCFYTTSVHPYIVYRSHCTEVPHFEFYSEIKPEGLSISNENYHYSLTDDLLAQLSKMFGYVHVEKNVGAGKMKWFTTGSSEPPKYELVRDRRSKGFHFFSKTETRTIRIVEKDNLGILRDAIVLEYQDYYDNFNMVAMSLRNHVGLPKECAAHMVFASEGTGVRTFLGKLIDHYESN